MCCRCDCVCRVCYGVVQLDFGVVLYSHAPFSHCVSTIAYSVCTSSDSITARVGFCYLDLRKEMYLNCYCLDISPHLHQCLISLEKYINAKQVSTRRPCFFASLCAMMKISTQPYSLYSLHRSSVYAPFFVGN